MKVIVIAIAAGLLAGCAPLAGAAIGGAGGYVVGRETEYRYHEPDCWTEWVGRDYYGRPIYEQHCR